MTVFVKDPKRPDHVMARYFEIHDPSLIESLKHLRRPQQIWINRAANSMRRVLQTSVTRGFDFMVGQLARDPVMNYALSRNSKSFWHWLKTSGIGLKHTLQFAVTGKNEIVQDVLANLGGGGTMTETGVNPGRGLWAMDVGGGLEEAPIFAKVSNAFGYALRGTHVDWRRTRALVKYGQRHTPGLSKGERAKGLLTPDPLFALRFLDRLTMATEMAPRIGEVVRAREEGKEGYELGKYYREASVDFSQQGTSPYMNFLNTWVPFLRAQIASYDRFARATGIGYGVAKGVSKIDAMRKGAVGGRHSRSVAFARISRADPNKKVATLMKGVVMIMASGALEAWNSQFEDYNQLDPKQKANYNHWYIPIGMQDDGTMRMIRGRVPRPYDFGLFTAVFDSFLRFLWRSEDPAARGLGFELWHAMKHQMFPGLPPIVNMFFKAGMNWDPYTGGPVVSNTSVEPYLQTSPGTQRTFDEAALKLREKGIANVSPAKSKAIFDAQFATWPGIIAGVMDWAFYDAPLPDKSRVAGLRRVVLPPKGTTTRWQADYHQLTKIIKMLDASMSMLADQERDDLSETIYSEADRDMADLAPMVASYDAELADLRRRLKEVGREGTGAIDNETDLRREIQDVYRDAVEDIRENIESLGH